MIKNDKEVIVLKNYVIKVNQIRWIKLSKFFRRIKIRLMNNELIVVKFDSSTEYSRFCFTIERLFDFCFTVPYQYRHIV